MKSNERWYVWYGADGEVEGVGTVLMPQLGVLRVSGGPEATEKGFGLQVLEVDFSQYPDTPAADTAAIRKRFCVVNGELRERGPRKPGHW